MSYSTTKSQVKTWGEQFNDRSNSFDDEKEINIFIKTVGETKELQNYISKFLPNVSKNGLVFQPHPHGKYGVDLGIRDKSNGNKLVMVFDLERWSQWDNDFPTYYKYLSFLSRKNKFLQDDVPFIMVWQNKDCSKYLMVDDSIIRETPSEKVVFKSGYTDSVRKIPLEKGTILGAKGEREIKYFSSI